MSGAVSPELMEGGREEKREIELVFMQNVLHEFHSFLGSLQVILARLSFVLSGFLF